MPDKYRVVCMFARQRGVEALKGILADGRFSVPLLLVHGRLPASEDPGRAERPELKWFRETAAANGMKFGTIDTREEAFRLEMVDEIGEFDFLATVSWRFLVPERVFSRAKIGAVNAHRGKLPQYAGAEPIKRALQNGEDTITLTVHEMAAEIDAGEVLVENMHPSNYDSGKSLDENVERIKREMFHLYPIAVIGAMEKILRKKQ